MFARKAQYIALNALPVFIMVGLIPLIGNDLTLAFIYIGITALSLLWRQEKYDLTAFIVGVLLMTLSEYLFIQTGVETFSRTTLWGIMPLWLPVLWGYGFIAVKRIVEIVDGHYQLGKGKWI